MRQHIAHEVHAAALPGGVQHLGDGCLDAFMGVGDHQLDPAQAPPSELAQELRAERLGLGRTDVHAEHFPPAVAVDTDCDDHRNRDDAPALTHSDLNGTEIFPMLV
jgi:hypothetical protein